jgi:exosortase H (IPTLxxWG-CTERM-specific)
VKKFLLLFVFLLLALSFVYNLEAVMEYAVQPWNHLLAYLSHGLLQLLGDEVLLRGNVLTEMQNAFSVSVENDCNGIEATLILAASVLAFPSHPGWKMAGVLAGFLIIQAMNVVRIVTLFYLGQWNTEVFDWTHKYLWPAVIIFAALVVFFIWIRLLPKRLDRPV